MELVEFIVATGVVAAAQFKIGEVETANVGSHGLEPPPRLIRKF
jgi:hypothetical protein